MKASFRRKALGLAAAGAVAALVGCGSDWDRTDGPGDVSGDRLWVLDQYNGKVMVFDGSGETLFELDGFPKPSAVDVYAADGSTWICDYYGNFVRKYTYGGALLFQSYVEGYDSLLKQPTGLDVNQDDGSCWVADRNNNRVVKFSNSGETVAIVSGFNFPRAVSLDPSTGDCWVTDEKNGAVVLLPADVSGEVNVSAVERLRVKGFGSPWAVAAEPSGGCWVGDFGTGSVVRLNANGAITANLTGFAQPGALFVEAATGDFYVGDLELGTVARFSQATTGDHDYEDVANLIITDPLGTAAVWVEPADGRIYVADIAGDRVLVYNNAGSIIKEITGADDPAGVAYWINIY